MPTTREEALLGPPSPEAKPGPEREGSSAWTRRCVDPATGVPSDGPCRWLARGWARYRWGLFVVLAVLPFVVYRDDIVSILELWYVPIMVVAASALNGSGAPIAGGIIYFPILSSFGRLCPRDVVAFSAATQALGIGLLTPLNWFMRDLSVFYVDIIRVGLLPGAAGLALSLFIMPYVSGTTNKCVYISFLINFYCHVRFLNNMST